MDWLRKLQSWIYANLFLPRGDWTHMAFELWLWALSVQFLGRGYWWQGIAIGVGLEVFQFFLIDRRKWHLADRLSDVWGHSVTVSFAFPSFYSILAALSWYLFLVAQRQAQGQI